MKKIGIILALMMASATSLMAQETNSGYFTSGYLYRHELNPAFDGGQGYVSMPILGNLNLGLRGNLNMENFIYNVNGKTTTFMNPNVSADEVLKNIKDQNKLMLDLKLQILSVGFKAFGGYNTVGLNIRNHTGVTLPGSLFRMAKEGIENKSYDLSGLNVSENAYAEIALGHSHKINEDLTVGAKAKILLGAANLEAKLNKANLNLNAEGNWNVEAEAQIEASVKGLKYESELSDTENPRMHVTDLDVDGPGLNGFGLAFDLGAEYKIIDGLAVSAAFTDLGFINWSNRLLAKSYPGNHVTTSDYIFNVDDNSANNFEDELDKLGDDLAGLADLQDLGDQGSTSKGLGSTMRIGVEYKMPFYDKLSVGLLNTTRFQSNYNWTEFRLAANVAPIKAISLGLNYAVGTFGSSFGWIVDIHPKGFNLFLAMDHTIGSVSKQFIPLKSNAHLNFGINIPF